MVSFIPLKWPCCKISVKGDKALGHPRSPEGRDQMLRSCLLVTLHQTECKQLARRLTTNIFRLEVRLWCSVMPTDTNSLAKAPGGKRQWTETKEKGKWSIWWDGGGKSQWILPQLLQDTRQSTWTRIGTASHCLSHCDLGATSCPLTNTWLPTCRSRHKAQTANAVWGVQ